MHEMSVATSIVDIVVSQLGKSGATKVIRARVTIGELSGVEADSVQFCYSSAAKDTPAEGSELIINKVEAMAICVECASRFKPEGPLAVCPKCGAFSAKMEAGEELFVDQIEVE